MDKKFYLNFFFVALIYFLLRIFYPETVEFGYDQPKTATLINQFLERGTYLTSQNFTQVTIGGSIAWGPALIFFYAPFLAITHNPLIVSYLILIFNILSVFFIFYVGWKFFSPSVGIIAGLFLAINPWWIIFSRMIYQPTPVPFFIALSIFLFLNTVKNPKSFWFVLLLLSWGVLIQTYLITFSFIATSLLILIIFFTKNKNDFSVKYLLFGLILNTVIFLPSIFYYINNPDIFYKFITATHEYKTSVIMAIKSFVEILSGGGFEWQLGYGYEMFKKGFGGFETFLCLVKLLMVSILVSGSIIAIRSKNIKKISILLFVIAPIWALPAIGVEHIVPRYFLYVLPSLSLFVGITIEHLVIRFSKLFYVFPIFLFIFWIFFIFKYFIFIISFNYPNGFLSNWSDVPYSYLDKSFKWMANDSQKKGYNSFTVSSDLNHPKEFRFNEAQRYYWGYILRKDENLTDKIGHYLMYFSSVSDKHNVDSVRFGPYVIINLSN
jgi:hypothetical protein